MNKQKIIEIVEQVMFEMGYITRPHADCTDDFFTELEQELSSLKAEAEKQVDLNCQVCGKDFRGDPPKMCCSGRDCGCMGQPIEPIVCSNECYDRLMNKEAEKEVTDNDIYLWAENEYGCSGTQSIACKRDVNIAIIGAKAMRDGKIKPNNQ